MRPSPLQADNYLGAARAYGWIYGYERLATNKGVRWRIIVPATRFDAYNDPDARGEIVLSTREVMAFVEGMWSAHKINPNHRAGGRD